MRSREKAPPGPPAIGWTHPNKAGRKPSLVVDDAPPPPLLVGGVHHLDDVAGLEAELSLIHGDVIPERLGVHHVAVADELRGGSVPREIGSPLLEQTARWMIFKKKSR